MAVAQKPVKGKAPLATVGNHRGVLVSGVGGRVNVEVSEELGRSLRKDAPALMGESSWEALEDAIRAGKQGEAIRLLEYLHWAETATWHYFFTDWLYGNQTYVVENWGEDAYEEMFRTEENWGISNGKLAGYEPEFLTDVEALTKMHARTMRAHLPPSNSIHITEEKDRYVLTTDCYSGGRMLQRGMTEGKWNLAVNKKALGRSWGMTTKPIYCNHCALGRGIIVSEIRGFPLRVNELPGSGFNPDINHPNDPCRFIFYKKPEDIPDRYFEALGLKKDPSKFQIVPPQLKAKKK